MANTEFGGRFSTNRIEDVRAPDSRRGLVPVRDGLSAFRPLEDVAGNFMNTSPLPRRERKDDVSDSSDWVPVRVNIQQPKVLQRSPALPRPTVRPVVRKAEVKQWATSLSDYLEKRWGKIQPDADYRFDERSVETMKFAGITVVLLFGLLVFSHDLLNRQVHPTHSSPQTTQSTSPSQHNGTTIKY